MRHWLRAFLLALLLSSLAGAAASANGPPLPLATPGAVGMSAEQLARIETVLKAEIEKGRIPGAVVAIARRGRLVYHQAVGFLDKERMVGMPADALFSIASMTKPIVSLAIMMLVEEGKLLLADPVGKHLPPLAAMKVGIIKIGPDGKEVVETVSAMRQPTIQDLLRHTSGFTYGARGTTLLHKMHLPATVGSAMKYTGKEFIEALAALPLLHQPGTVWDYSVSTDILGLVVEAVSGKSLNEFLQERILRPLAMVDSGFGVPAAKKSRYALAFPNDPITGRPQSVMHATGKPLKFECGGACMVSTAADYIRFSQFLANKGELDGKRLVGRKTIELMTSNHLGPEIQNNVAAAEPSRAGYTFGLGFAVRQGDGVTAAHGSQGDYSWGGAFGTYFWVDPREQLAVVFMSAAPGAIRTYYRQLMTSLVMSAIVD